MNKVKVFKIATLATSLLLGVSIFGTEASFTWQNAISRYLGIQGESINGEGGEKKYKSDYSTAKDLVETKKDLIKRIGSEGCVLLKNDNQALPVASGAKVSLFGRTSTNIAYGASSGSGQINIKCDDYNTVLTSEGISVNPTLWDYFKGIKGNVRRSGSSGIRLGEVDPDTYPSDVKSSYDQYKDAAFVVITRNFGEGDDASRDPKMVMDGDGVHHTLELQDVERKIITEAKKCSSKVIVIINSDNPLGIDELKQDADVDAILLAGGMGYTGLYGVGDVIAGKTSPSGHLTDTYAASTISAPAVQNFGDFDFTNASDITAAMGTKYVVYQEGIYVGYKYYETRYEDSVLNQGNATSAKGAFVDTSKWQYTKEVSYPFGYGLSYTTFDRKINSIDWDETKKTVTIKATTKNTGSVSGKDVLEVFVQSPYTDYDKTNSVEKAADQLAGFEKTDTLKPGASADVDITLDMNLFASYDYTKAKTYILDYGTYYFSLGNGAHDALNNILAAKGKKVSDGMDYEGNSAAVASYEKKKGVSTTDVDDVTCSVSEYTGTKITNQMDQADLNHYGDGLVTYLSRSDWDKTWSDGVKVTATDAMKTDLNDGSTYTPSAKASDLSKVVEGTDYASTATAVKFYELNGLSYDDPKWTDALNQLTLEEMSRLVGLANSGAISSINMPAYMAFDGPSGLYAKYKTDDEDYALYATMFASECVLSNTFNKELAEEEGKMFGNDGLWTGYECAWGPGNDTHRTAFGGRNNEYYSEDGILAYYITGYECKGAVAYGFSMGPKHLAFNDQETNRGGVATFVNEQAGREIYLRSFEGALTLGEAHCTMCSKNRLGCLYVGAFEGLMRNILIGEWNYHGTVIADSASDGYVNGPKSVLRGTTEFDTMTSDFSGDNGSLSPAIISHDGELFAAMKEACHRNLYLWANTWLVNGLGETTVVSKDMAWYQKMMIGLTAGFAVLTAGTLTFFLIEKGRKSKEAAKKEAK